MRRGEGGQVEEQVERTVTQCHTIMEEMATEEDCLIPTPDNCATFQATIRVERPKILKAAKAKVVDIYKKKAQEAASKVPFQGELLSLMAQEETDMAWRCQGSTRCPGE